MATSTNTYGFTTGLERRIGDIVASRAFTTATVPTSCQAVSILEDIAADMNRALLAAGYQAPISTGDFTNRRWAQKVNEDGAAAMVLATLPMTAIAPNAEDAGANRAELYWSLFNAGMTAIQENRISATRVTTRLGNTMAGSQSDSDNNRKLPFFTRDMDRNPRRISGLTE